MVSISVKMAESMKVNSQIIKNLVMVFKSTLMVTYTLVYSKIVKNMDMVNSSGLIYQAKTPNKTNMWNIMMENGGVDYLMVLESIKKSMVSFLTNLGDLYTGSFKNGLKHG